MKFCLGKVPPDPGFDPAVGGWRKVREPGMGVFWLLAIPLSVAMFVGTSIAIGSVDDPSAKIVVRPGEVTVAWVVGIVLLGIGFFLGVVILHEAVHLVAHPGFGLSDQSVLGIWPKAGVAYAFYGGELSRNRLLFIIALPLLLLTVLPVVWFHLTGRVNMWVAVPALMNALGASFDVLVVGMVLRQVPSAATLRNSGWDTYWRPQRSSAGR